MLTPLPKAICVAWPVETGGLECTMQDQRSSGCLVCSATQPFLGRRLIQEGFDFLHVVCCPISHDQCLLYQSNISHSQQLQQLWFYCSDAMVGGAPRGAFVRHPGCRAKRGHRNTCFLKAIPRNQQFGQRLLFSFSK